MFYSVPALVCLPSRQSTLSRAAAAVYVCVKFQFSLPSEKQTFCDLNFFQRGLWQSPPQSVNLPKILRP